MLNMRKLTQKDKEKLNLLINNTEQNSVNKVFWLPIQKKAYNNFFNDEWTIFIGIFDKNNLIAASALFLNEFEYGDSIKLLKVKGKIAEIGRCMVLPEYRGKNLMYKLNLELEKIAKDKGVKYLIATAHPDNISSIKSLKKLGMEYMASTIKYLEYPRDIYLKKI